VTGKILTALVAVLAAASLTLGAVFAVVRGTMAAIAVGNLPLRILAVTADALLGSLLLIGCTYLATRLAVRILGVGRAEFPPPPISAPEEGHIKK
jgi:hypothetical protein